MRVDVYKVDGHERGTETETESLPSYWLRGHAEPGIISHADVIVVEIEYRVSLVPVSVFLPNYV